MYLDRNDTLQLVDRINNLSIRSSKIILNFSTNAQSGAALDEISSLLENSGWTRTATLFFGDTNFSFGRYPQNQQANTTLGFSMFLKI